MPITVSHAKSDTLGDWGGTVTVNNSSGGTTTVAGSDLVRPSDWNSVHQGTLAITGSEIASLFNFGTGLSSTTAAGGISAGINSQGFYEPFPLANTNSTISAPGIGTWYFDGPYLFEAGLPNGQFNFLLTHASGFLNGGVYSAAVTGSVSKYMTVSHHLALYQVGASASTSRLESVWTSSIGLYATENFAVSSTATSDVRATHNLTVSLPSQFNASGGLTYGSTTTGGSSFTGASTMVSTAIDSMVSAAARYVTGALAVAVPFGTTLAPGVYWLAHMYSSTSSTAGTGYAAGTMFSTQSYLGLLENVLSAYKRIGFSTSNASTNFMPFHGYLATVSSSATSIVNTVDIKNTTGRMYWNFFQSTY